MYTVQTHIQNVSKSFVAISQTIKLSTYQNIGNMTNVLIAYNISLEQKYEYYLNMCNECHRYGDSGNK